MLNEVYPHYREYAYHLYGDNSDKAYSFQELRKHFSLDGTSSTICNKTLAGDPRKMGFFTFMAGKIYSVERSISGFVIR
jgi:hypothetical protein